MIAKQQLRLSFEPSIRQQFKTLTRCVAAVVYSSKAGLDGCATACDVSPSTLSRMLNEQQDSEQKRHLPADFIDIIVDLTKDTRPIEWLAARHLHTDEQRDEALLSRLEQFLPDAIEAVHALKRRKR